MSIFFLNSFLKKSLRTIMGWYEMLKENINFHWIASLVFIFKRIFLLVPAIHETLIPHRCDCKHKSRWAPANSHSHYSYSSEWFTLYWWPPLSLELRNYPDPTGKYFLGRPVKNVIHSRNARVYIVHFDHYSPLSPYNLW